MQASHLTPNRAPNLSARVSDAVWRLRLTYSRFFLIALLVLLHVAAVRGVSDPWARGLLVAHLGMLLMWQPFLQVDQRINATQALLIALASLAVMLWLGWWLLAFWVVVLAGMVGGKVYQQDERWQRGGYLSVLVYLLALLAVMILPEIAPRREIAPEIRRLAALGLPVLFLPIVLFPGASEGGDEPQLMDFFYSVFLMLVLGLMILGSFTFMTLSQTSYLAALSYTMFGIGGGVLLIGLVWSPRTGVAGLNVFFSRYLMSIGVPMEKWLHFLAVLFQTEASAGRFIAEGIEGLRRFTWVSGATWVAGPMKGEVGDRTSHYVEYIHLDLQLVVYSRYRLSSALEWHLRLLSQLLGEFYLAKTREQKLLQQGYLEAVHETGARVTHDVKNLLQSLNVLCSVAMNEGSEHSPETQALLRRQLPVITSRLGETLRKLERPEIRRDSPISVVEWWKGLKRQYQAENVQFSSEGLKPGLIVPGNLFDTVADNLLRNALAKRSAIPGIRVACTLSYEKETALCVQDDGERIPAHIAKDLLRNPVKSDRGLGIGLYQAARHAESQGYMLELVSNVTGDVRFLLRPRDRYVADYGSTPAEIKRM